MDDMPTWGSVSMATSVSFSLFTSVSSVAAAVVFQDTSKNLGTLYKMAKVTIAATLNFALPYVQMVADLKGREMKAHTGCISRHDAVATTTQREFISKTTFLYILCALVTACDYIVSAARLGILKVSLKYFLLA